MAWENDIDPYNSGAYRANHRKDHWHGGMPHASQCPRQQIHDTA